MGRWRHTFPCVLHHSAAGAALSTAAFCSPRGYRDRCVRSMCVCVCAHLLCVLLDCTDRGKVCGRSRNMCGSRFTHTPHHCTTPPPPSGLQRGCQACESATVLSRQEGNNGFAVLPVCLAAFMQHFSEGNCRLLAPRALLTRPLPAGHWPVVPTVPAARQASEGYRLSHSNWCLGSGWSKVASCLWSPGNFPFSAYSPVHLSSSLPRPNL